MPRHAGKGNGSLDCPAAFNLRKASPNGEAPLPYRPPSLASSPICRAAGFSPAFPMLQNKCPKNFQNATPRESRNAARERLPSFLGVVPTPPARGAGGAVNRFTARPAPPPPVPRPSLRGPRRAAQRVPCGARPTPPSLPHPRTLSAASWGIPRRSCVRPHPRQNALRRNLRRGHRGFKPNRDLPTGTPTPPLPHPQVHHLPVIDPDARFRHGIHDALDEVVHVGPDGVGNQLLALQAVFLRRRIHKLDLCAHRSLPCFPACRKLPPELRQHLPRFRPRSRPGVELHPAPLDIGPAPRL